MELLLLMQSMDQPQAVLIDSVPIPKAVSLQLSRLVLEVILHLCKHRLSSELMMMLLSSCSDTALIVKAWNMLFA